MQMNDRMCVSIAGLFLTSRRFSILRRTGTQGSILYEYLWRSSFVPLSLQVPTTTYDDSEEGEEHYQHPPLDYPACLVLVPSGIDGERLFKADLVVSVAAIATFGIDVETFNYQHLFDLNPIRDLQFIHCANADFTLVSNLACGLLPTRSITFDKSVETCAYIPPQFLSNCAEVGEIDLANFTGVKEMGSGFLFVTGVKSVDLTVITRNLQYIPSSFLEGLRELRSIDLSPLEKFTEIPDGFLSGCASLTEVDLSPLRNITSIGEGFLLGCEGIRELDISPLHQIQSLPIKFLSGLKSLKVIDLSSFSHITAIPAGVLSNCRTLSTVSNLAALSSIETISDAFLMGCQIPSIDLAPFSRITQFPENFLSNCILLSSIDLSPLSNVTSISPRFLQGCAKLVEVDMAPLFKLTRIPSQFMWGCKSLRSIDMSKLVDVIYVDADQFMFGCHAIKVMQVPTGNTLLGDVARSHRMGPEVEEL